LLKEVFDPISLKGGASISAGEELATSKGGYSGEREWEGSVYSELGKHKGQSTSRWR